MRESFGWLLYRTFASLEEMHATPQRLGLMLCVRAPYTTARHYYTRRSTQSVCFAIVYSTQRCRQLGFTSQGEALLMLVV